MNTDQHGSGTWGHAVCRLVTLMLLFACTAAFAQEEQEHPPEFKVDVRLVNVFTSVTDSHGVPVGALTKDNFRIFEDGAEQKISVFQRESAIPLSIALEVDTSLSTRKDIHLELEAAKRFVHATVRPKTDSLALFTISENVDQVLGFSSQPKAIDRAINDVRPGAATALYDGITLGAEALRDRQGRKVMVLITDGGDTASKSEYQDASRSALEAEAIVYSIIVVPIESNAGRNTGGEHALIQISSDTGGRYYYANNIQQVERAFEQISDELRTQYLLAYYPSKRLSDSDFRRIEVKLVDAPADRGTLTAHYRTGYYTH